MIELTLLDISGIGISIFGVAGFLCVLREEKKYQKLGTILGLCSNPFWWLMVITTQQWMTIPVHLLYTYGWLNKAYVLWLKKGGG